MNDNFLGVNKGEIDRKGSSLESVCFVRFLFLDKGDSASCVIYLGTVLRLGLLNMVNCFRILSTICLRVKSNDIQYTIESYLIKHFI